ncbi:hypothetical protein [Afipia sp. 1NLS2]|uniref:hypothetical protein n=1 Tax=Afipia sp. 1NLS2 TaxID=666684 RepID=UPI0001D9E6A3|nr:hypothetical protein [Afipia sp. 1NLS2]EFI51972.1 conserved hypothetical protein [Afipia sp. 1NLS2]MBE0703936.1 hypothetical protein [Afipia sp.]
MPRKDKKAATSRSEQPKQSTVATTPQLVWTVVLVSIAVTIVTELRIAGHGSLWLSTVMAYAAFFLNIACSGLGFRTPQQMWWIANVGVSVLTMSFIGAPTVPSALWTVGRVFLARLST